MPNASELTRQDEDREADVHQPMAYQPVAITEAGVEALRLAEGCGPRERPPSVPYADVHQPGAWSGVKAIPSNPNATFQEYARVVRERDAARAELAALEGRFLTAHMALRIIAEDQALECRCGHPPYTDGEQCPRCFASVSADLLGNTTPKPKEP